MSLHFCASKIGDFRIFAMAFFILTYIQYYKRAMSQGLIQNEQTILKKKITLKIKIYLQSFIL